MRGGRGRTPHAGRSSCPRTKVRSPARPRARHPAPCPAPRSPCPRAPLSALARRSRYSPCPPVPLAGARRPRPQAPRMRGRQCWTLTGITFPDNQTRSWLTSQNNQKVVLTGIQYHFGPGAETGPDRPSRALEPSDRHLHTPKQPFHFKYHLFSCRIRPSPAVSGRFRPYSYVFQSIGAVRCRGHG